MENNEEEDSRTQEERGSSGDGCNTESEPDSRGEEEDSEQSSQNEVGESRQGVVYFIETEDSRFIKIGYSKEAHRRLRDLGTLRPGNFALRLLGWIPGTFETERWIQRKFEVHRDNGEWFRNAPEIRAFIGMLGVMKSSPRQRQPRRKSTLKKRAGERMDVSEMARLGGKARAEKMTAEERKASSKRAIEARWGVKKPAGKKAVKKAGKK